MLNFKCVINSNGFFYFKIISVNISHVYDCYYIINIKLLGLEQKRKKKE